MKIAVLSDGAWATSLALVLVRNGHEVTLWGPFSENIENMRATRRNDRFLKNSILPNALSLTSEMSEAIRGAELILLAAPSQYARSCQEKLRDAGFESTQTIVNVAKGIEIGTLLRMSQLCEEVVRPKRYCVLSGPSHAEEVLRSVPTAVVAASTDESVARAVQDAFMNEYFRVYTSDDVIGVELGGALKNVFAIAAGSCDGMNLGDNTKAALITRGVAEMARLGMALGGSQETFSGLSGIGDMIVTCTSQHSRNRHVGEELGKGVSLDSIIESMGMVVAEGVTTTKSAYALAQKERVETPIINEIYAGLYDGKDLRLGLRDLMTRKARDERD